MSDCLSKQIFKRSLHLQTPAEPHVGQKLLMDKKKSFSFLFFLFFNPTPLHPDTPLRPSLSLLLPSTFSFFPTMWKSHPRSGHVTVRCGIHACRVKVDIRIKKQSLVPPWLLTLPLSLTELFRSGDTGKIRHARTHARTQTGTGRGRK